MKIGFFDSGIGGLSILKQVISTMPNYSYVYYADNKNNPYGKKSTNEILQLTIDAIEFLFKKDCELVILACNSATTVLPAVQHEWLPKNYPQRRVLGVIRPTAEHIINTSFKNNFLIATSATVNANSYTRELVKLGSSKPLTQISCPDLASEIEQHLFDDKNNINTLLQSYLSLVPNTTDTAIFSGCTHYEFVAKNILQLHSNVTFISQADVVAKSLKMFLQKHLLMPRFTAQSTEFFASGDSVAYLRFLVRLAGAN